MQTLCGGIPVLWRFLRIGLLVSVALPIGWPAAAQAQRHDGPAVLQADQLVWQEHGRAVSATGEVKLQRDGGWIHADTVRMRPDRDLVEAWGNVRWQNTDGRGEAAHMRIHTDTRTGVMYDAEIEDRQGTQAWGERIEQLGPREFRVHDGGFTPCDCPNGKPATWKITVRKARLNWDQSVAFTQGAFWSKNFPVFFLPAGYTTLPDRRQSGILLPRITRSDRFGWEIEPGLFLALGRTADLTGWYRYTSLGGMGWSVEGRNRTRTGTQNARFEWFKEADDAPALRDTDPPRPPERRWSLNLRTREEPWDLLRLRLDATLLSNRSLSQEFADDLDDLTRTTTRSDLELSREFDGLGALIGRFALSQAVVSTSDDPNVTPSSTGSRTPSLWLRIDPQGPRNWPIWGSAFARVDLFSAFEENLGEPWEPSAYKLTGRRFSFGGRTGMRLDPAPGLILETTAGLRRSFRERHFFDRFDTTPDDGSNNPVPVTRSVLTVTPTTTFWLKQDAYWGLRARGPRHAAQLRLGGRFQMVRSNTSPFAIEDVDSVTDNTWFAPRIEATGRAFEQLRWYGRYWYPFDVSGGTVQAFGNQVFEAGMGSRWVDVAGQLWLNNDGNRFDRFHGEISMQWRPHLQISLGFARKATGSARIPWDLGRFGGFGDNFPEEEGVNELTAELSWSLWRFSGDLGLRRRLDLGTLQGGWVERRAGIRYQDACDCWSVGVRAQDLPGEAADRVQFEINFALLGGTAFE